MALDFDVLPYYDDTAQNAIPNNYLRILFKPGFAVQARELTALQSILQNQISSLGSFVFQDGSPVTGGHISLDTTVKALKLNQQFANVDINLSGFLVGGNATLITDTTGIAIKAVVMAIDPTQINPTILVKYLTANEFTPGQTIQVAVGVQTQASLIANNASNPATVASISQGTFYSGGFFIDVLPQTIVVDSTTALPNARIGLQIQETIISSADDSTLLDPALGSSNYQAPGADRYQYLLVLSTRSFTSIDDSKFYDLLEVQNGLITKQIDYPVFADLDKALAARTYDTNGNFTVRPFGITTAANTANTSNFDIVVTPGKAYVKGFEFHTIGTQRLSVPRALQTNTVNSFGFSLEFGNILVTNNLNSGNISGFFDIANFPNVDVHCVQTANINTTNATTYGATKMGVARLRDVEFLGLGQYFSYITDINITGNNFIAAAGSTNTITLPASYSNSLGTNAYANVLVTVNTGGVFDTRTITTYAAATRVATLDRPLTVTATAASNVTLNYDIKDSEALVVVPNSFGANAYYLQNTTTPLYACMDISVGGKGVAGNTILSDSQFNKLIFPLPQNFIAQNTIISAQFNHRKNLFSQTFTSGNLALSTGSGLGTGESFPYGFTGSYLPDSIANTNFLVTVRNKQSGNIANGVVVNWDRNSNPGGNGVFQTDSTHVTLVINDNNTFTGDILLTVQVTNAAQASVARRAKTLVGNTSNTVLLATDSYLNSSVVIGTPNANTVWVDTTNAYVWFTGNPDIPKTPGTRMGMGIADVFKIIAIYDSGNTSFMPNVANSLDITNRYVLDTGQRDNYYNHSGLILQTGNAPPTGQVVALVQFFQHDAVNGFFDADSYSTAVYNTEGIPYYNSLKFNTFTLRDCIDFRPTRTPGYSANIQSFSLTGLDLPQPDSAFTLGYQFYLPRVDKFQVTKDKNFRVVQGVPNVYPQPPSDSDDAMTCYVVSVPAFTANTKTIGLQYIENKRYTMRDIGTLDTRIQQLEYYSALSQLEAQTVNQKILYQDGVTAKDQYGVIADNFGAFSIADVNNPDLLCFMEPGSLGPLKAHWPLNFLFSSNTGGGYVQDGKCYCLAYTETPAVQQNAASTFISVQPYLFAQFKGSMVLSPSTDSFYSTNLIAQTTVATPVVPKPAPQPAAPTLKPFVPTPVTYVFGGGGWYPEIIDYWYNGYGRNFWYANKPYFYNRSSSGYGIVNIATNWYGTPIAKTPIIGSQIPFQSSSITLNPGGVLTQRTGG